MKRKLILALSAVTIVMVGAAAAFAWMGRSDKETAQDNETVQGAKRTYCSDYSYLCFDYPSEWRIETDKTTEEAISPERTTLTSPDGDTAVVYRPNFGVTGKVEAVEMSVINVESANEDLQVVSLVNKHAGSYDAEKLYSAEAYVTNVVVAATGDPLIPGATILSRDEPVFHTFTPKNNPNINSQLYIKFRQKHGIRMDAIYADYQTALDDLQQDTVRQAMEILKSARYR